jgi:hypothetical protein
MAEHPRIRLVSYVSQVVIAAVIMVVVLVAGAFVILGAGRSAAVSEQNQEILQEIRRSSRFVECIVLIPVAERTPKSCREG